MAREEVSFARGEKSTMPQDKVPGRLLIAVDTGEAYVDDTDQSRIQLKDSTKLPLSGGTMTGPINMGSNKITNVATPSADTDAANLGSVKSQITANQYKSGTAITVNNTNHTISHNAIGTAGSVGPTENSTASHGGTITVPYVTVDAQGHVSAKANRTITLPAGPVNMKGATTSAAGAAGYAPAPSAGASNRYLRSDGTWAVPPDTNTTYSNMTGATADAEGKAGLVPAPAAGKQTSYLRGDGTWVVPPNTTYSAFKGASASVAGGAGLVPAPATGYQSRFLRGDGTWAVVPDNNTTYSAGTGLSLSGTTFSLATSGVTAGSYGPTANVSGTNNTTINIPQITVDAYGRVTSVTNRVLTNKDTNTTYSNMEGASSSAAGTAGLVPAPSAGASNRYLRSDGTWAVPPDTNTTYADMTGSTTSAAGTHGLVPAPEAGSATRYLRCDGTWQVPPNANTTYTAGRGLSLSGTQFGHSNAAITAGNGGPTANATVSPGGTITVPYIAYDAYGHITSRTNRTITLNSNILDTGDILTTLSGVTSNTKVLGAKLVADAINSLNSQVSKLNTNLDKIKYSETHGSGYSVRTYTQNNYIEVFATAKVTTDFSYNAIGSSGLYWSLISNIALHANFSSLYFFHANVTNSGVIFSGDFLLVNQNSVSGSVIQVGSGQRDTYIHFHAFGVGN